jgi:acetyl esterase/lipase
MASTTTTSIPRPYSVLWHPYLTWAQKIISFVVGYLVPVYQLGQTEIGSPEAKVYTDKLRKVISEGDTKLEGNAIKEWSQATNGCPIIAESIGSIPFRKNILKEWNIIAEEKDIMFPEALHSRKEVKILVRFPSTLLATEEVVELGNILEYSGCVEVEFEKIDLRNFAPDVPVLIQFHGGGFVSGGMHDALSIGEVAKLVQMAEQNNDLITISVDYGLSPENPFPIAVMDGLSVIDYLLSGANSTRKVHITGISAGSSLSLITGLESFRKYPGRILSIQSQCPFINPAGDTMSYYMNQNTFPAMTWLRWCWRVYLHLEAPPELSEDSHEQKPTLEEVLRKDSNYLSWNKWKTKHPSKAVQRLVYPTLDLPESLNDENNAPKIIIRVNLADPLYDDGKEIADALKNANADIIFLSYDDEKESWDALKNAKADITFFQNTGLHVDFLAANVKESKKIFKIWSDTIFGV